MLIVCAEMELSKFYFKFAAKFENLLQQEARKQLEKYDIPIKLEKIDIKKIGSGRYNVAAIITGVDYEGLINRFLPKFLDKYKSKEKHSVFFDALAILEDEQSEIIKSVLDSISEKKRVKIIAFAVAQFECEICKLLTSIVSKKVNGIMVNSLKIVNAE